MNERSEGIVKDPSKDQQLIWKSGCYALAGLERSPERPTRETNMDHRGAGDSQGGPSGCRPCSGAGAWAGGPAGRAGGRAVRGQCMHHGRPVWASCSLPRTYSSPSASPGISRVHSRALSTPCACEALIRTPWQPARMSACCQGEATGWCQQVDVWVQKQAGTECT